MNLVKNVDLSNLAIVIPTLNRTRVLNRALNFYDKIKFNGTIYIVDGSFDNDYNVKIINNKSTSIKYFHDDKSKNEVIRISKISSYIDEEYVTFAGDDDFALPIGLCECVSFLEENLDYDMCFGGKLNFKIIDGLPNVVGANFGHDWDYNKPSMRFLEYMITGNSTNYSIHRKKIWNQIVDTDIETRYIGTELIMCSRAVILSRIKKLDRLTTLFDDTGGTSWPHKDCNTYNEPPPIFQLIHSENWSKDFSKFKKIIIDLIVKNEDITQEEATYIFGEGFMFRLSNMLAEQFSNKYGGNFVPLYDNFSARTNGYRKDGVKLHIEDVNFIQDNFKMVIK